jgi:hypothetical protein
MIGLCMYVCTLRYTRGRTFQSRTLFGVLSTIRKQTRKIQCAVNGFRKLIVVQLVTSFPALYRTLLLTVRRVFTEAATGPHLEQMNPVHRLTSCFFTTRFNIIIPFTPRSPKLHLLSRLNTRTVHSFLISYKHATCLTHLIVINSISPINWVHVHDSSPDNSTQSLHRQLIKHLKMWQSSDIWGRH